MGTLYLEGVFPECSLKVSGMRARDDLVAVKTIRSADQCAVGELPRDVASKNSISSDNER